MSSPVWDRRRYATRQRALRRRQARFFRQHGPTLLALIRAAQTMRVRWVTDEHHQHHHAEHHDFPLALDVNAPGGPRA